MDSHPKLRAERSSQNRADWEAVLEESEHMETNDHLPVPG